MIGTAKPKPSRLDRLAGKKQARAKVESKRKQVCRLVDVRDIMRCRSCGAKGSPYSVEWDKLHHHHIRYRSKGGEDDTANVCLLCALCHAAVHDRKLGISGDANGVLTFTGVTHHRDGQWTA